MYSIFRATSKNISLDFLNEIGLQMNLLRKDVYHGIRKAGDGFVCEISKANLWIDQINEITIFLNTFKEFIPDLKLNGYEVVIDIAIQPDDFTKQTYGLFLFHNQDFLATLRRSEVDYEISLYK